MKLSVQNSGLMVRMRAIYLPASTARACRQTAFRDRPSAADASRRVASGFWMKKAITFLRFACATFFPKEPRAELRSFIGCRILPHMWTRCPCYVVSCIDATVKRKPRLRTGAALRSKWDSVIEHCRDLRATAQRERLPGRVDQIIDPIRPR